MRDDVRGGLPAHAEPDHDQRRVRRDPRVDHGDRLLQAPAQAQLLLLTGAFAVPRELEGQAVTAPGGDVREQRQQPLLGAGTRAVQQHDRRHPGAATGPPYTPLSRSPSWAHVKEESSVMRPIHSRRTRPREKEVHGL